MTRIIKKYPNRRLYDTERSQYITVADVRELVLQGVDFKVVGANNDEDLTRSILLQIIMERESGERPLFTADILAKIIHFYDDSVQNVFTTYLEKSLNLFVEQQVRLQKQLQDMLASAPPIDALTDLTKHNLALWRDMQDQFLSAAGLKQAAQNQTSDAKDKSKDAGK